MCLFCDVGSPPVNVSTAVFSNASETNPHDKKRTLHNIFLYGVHDKDMVVVLNVGVVPEHNHFPYLYSFCTGYEIRHPRSDIFTYAMYSWDTRSMALVTIAGYTGTEPPDPSNSVPLSNFRKRRQMFIILPPIYRG